MSTRAHAEIDAADAAAALLGEDNLVWLDITNPGPAEAAMLRERFALHPLALEAIFEDHPRAMCVPYPGCYAMVMYDADWPEGGELALEPVVILVGPRLLVTLHGPDTPEIDLARRLWRSGGGLQEDTIATPLYLLLDALADDYFPITDRCADLMDDLETHLYADDGAAEITGVFALKRNLLVLRRTVAGQRDAINVLLRQDVDLMDQTSLVLLQTVYDHLVRLVETIDTYRDLLSTAMDIHLSVVSNRMNQVMKTLTVVSTILMSASLIAGIYGTNFTNLPELHMRFGYYYMLAAMAGISGILVALFRRVRWL